MTVYPHFLGAGPPGRKGQPPPCLTRDGLRGLLEVPAEPHFRSLAGRGWAESGTPGPRQHPGQAETGSLIVEMWIPKRTQERHSDKGGSCEGRAPALLPVTAASMFALSLYPLSYA